MRRFREQRAPAQKRMRPAIHPLSPGGKDARARDHRAPAQLESRPSFPRHGRSRHGLCLRARSRAGSGSGGEHPARIDAGRLLARKLRRMPAVAALEAERGPGDPWPVRLPAAERTSSSLSADRQIFILTDLDRSAYGYTPISGLNTALDEAAAEGVRNGTDPRPPSAESPWRGFGSDWASTGPLLAYYLWMYDDGYPGPNLDCASPGASGCWGHRHVILGEGLSLPQPEVLGVATNPGGGGRGGTALIVSSHAGASTYYTWAEAESEGAGSGTGGRRRNAAAATSHGWEGRNDATADAARGWGRRIATSVAVAHRRGRRTTAAPPPATVQPHRGQGQDEAVGAQRSRLGPALDLALGQAVDADIDRLPPGGRRAAARTDERELHGDELGTRIPRCGERKVNGVGGFTASFTFLRGSLRGRPSACR